MGGNELVFSSADNALVSPKEPRTLAVLTVRNLRNDNSSVNLQSAEECSGVHNGLTLQGPAEPIRCNGVGNAGFIKKDGRVQDVIEITDCYSKRRLYAR